jgi:hypothetical protein
MNKCRRIEDKRGGTTEGRQSLRRRVGGFEVSSHAVSKKILRKCSKNALWIGRVFVGQWTVSTFPPSFFFLSLLPRFWWYGGEVSWRIPSTSLYPLCFGKCFPPFNYIVWLKGHNYLQQNTTVYCGDAPKLQILCDRPIKLASCKKRNLN